MKGNIFQTEKMMQELHLSNERKPLITKSAANSLKRPMMNEETGGRKKLEGIRTRNELKEKGKVDDPICLD